MKLIDGKLVATDIKDRVKQEIAQLGIKPKLVVIQVGDNQASNVYINNKIKSCDYVGIESQVIKLDENCSEEDLLDEIYMCNMDLHVNGILVQLPLPKHINENKVLDAIDALKDVDCFHPYNIGKLYSGQPVFLPCTPGGIIEMLQYYGIPIAGKKCVVIGRSNIVGKPMAQLLLQHDGTVTTCHSKTTNLVTILKSSDIIVSAIGKAKFIDGSMIKKGSVVIDVGMNRDSNNKLCGDIDFESVKDVADYLTPVPGGVGLTTVAMLMKNTLTAYQLQNK